MSNFDKEKYDKMFMDDFAFSVFIDPKKALRKKLPVDGCIRIYFSVTESKNTICNIMSSENYNDRFMNLEASGITLYNENDEYDDYVGKKESFRKAINDFSNNLNEYITDEAVESFREFMWKRYISFENKNRPSVTFGLTSKEIVANANRVFAELRGE